MNAVTLCGLGCRMINSFNSYNDFRVRKALQILDCEPNQTVLGLARQLRLSKSRLSHLFKAQIGISVKSYVVSRRLQEAGRLLLTGTMEIKEIAYRVGYRHGPSFARAFKAQFGATPNRYRKAATLAATMDQPHLLILTPSPRSAARPARVRSELIRTTPASRSPAQKRGSLAS